MVTWNMVDKANRTFLSQNGERAMHVGDKAPPPSGEGSRANVDAVHLAFRGACKTHHVVLFFPQGVTVVWEITHIYPLHVGPWQRSLPKPHWL